MIYSL